MSLVSNLETRIAGWLKPLPHFPATAQKWLGTNVWWIVLVGVIMSGIGFLISLFAFFAALAISTSVASSFYAYTDAGLYGGGWLASQLVSLIFTVLAAILLATAISPLKNGKKVGWNRMFLVLLLNVVLIVLNAILTFNPFTFIFAIIFGSIGVAIGTYLLFEIRGHFIEHKSTKAAAKS